MKTILVKDRQVDVYNVNDFPYQIGIKVGCVTSGNKRYFEEFATFDIETTTVRDELGFMYVWQFCFMGNVCVGRTWGEFKVFLSRLMFYLFREAKLVIYVHNLAFEFQFMRNFFAWESIFATEKREPIYATTDNLEFRCSYKLSNMSLDMLTRKTPNIFFTKLDGEEFDYRKARYPDTELSDTELAYCVVDVLGLEEAIKYMLSSNNDNLATIPLTSTGYIRRDYRTVCLQDEEHMLRFKKCKLDVESYILCREASRGAIAGSNHIHTDETLEYVDSFDKKSSYPEQMLVKYFPSSKFSKLDVNTNDEKFYNSLDTMCCLIVWSCKNLKLKKWRGIPYISKAKCRAISGASCGNGKVYSAERIGMCCTEIDYKIIENDYNFTDVVVHKMLVASRGKLSKVFRQHLSEMFQHKTDLDGVDVELYNKYKNKINSSFGMMLTDILNDEIVYEGGEEPWKLVPIEDMAGALNRYYGSKKSFLNYQDGVWILAHAREELHRGMELVGDDLVLVDTDSVKCLGDYKRAFKKLNAEIIKRCNDNDVKAYSIDKSGKRVYLGVWEHEGKEKYTYEKFRTLGAKKYCYIEGDKLKVTVSGLNKYAGWYLDSNGNGIDSFTSGFVFPYRYNGKKVSGRSALLYNDEVDILHTMVDGHSVVYSSNIAFREATYTLGMATEWYKMVSGGLEIEEGQFKGWID